MKMDQVLVYRHQRVYADDQRVNKIGDRFFVELCFMFGLRSSLGCAGRLLALFVAHIDLLSGISSYRIEKHLDDVLAVDSGRVDDSVDRFH